jgi:hypothetical protein
MICCCSCVTSGERDRYQPFVNLLNEILLHSESRRQRRQGPKVENGDIIFAINDPKVIESKHLPSLAASTKRKPDLICLLATRFRLLHENCQDFSFEDCVPLASKLETVKSNIRVGEVEKTTWGDILHSWELEAKGKINSEIRKVFKVTEFLSKDEEKPSDEPLAVASTSQGKCTLVS